MVKFGSCSITNETFDSLYSYWCHPKIPLAWDCLFVSPMWMKAWWDVFGRKGDLRFYGVRSDPGIIGIAPFIIEGKTVHFVGHGDVCDYLDFIVVPGQETTFFHSIIPFLREQGITRLDLGPLHMNSTVYKSFRNVAEALNCHIQLHQEDVLFELALPDTWAGYLDLLPGKYRHEIRRKLRRLKKEGHFHYRMVADSQRIDNAMDVFLALFRANRPDKSRFMSDQMASFFKSLASSLVRFDMLNLYFLELNGEPVAAVMCLDYRSAVYMYNNGYNERYAWLSVGFISKFLSIKDCIQRGEKTYNFLKGSEDYKRQLGGKEVPVYRCEVRL
jgi:CelD/BcsL family acetyltransferase involved in cellulose biosynthesis